MDTDKLLTTLEQEVESLEKVLTQLDALIVKSHNDKKVVEGKLLQTKGIIAYIRKGDGDSDQDTSNSDTEESTD